MANNISFTGNKHVDGKKLILNLTNCGFVNADTDCEVLRQTEQIKELNRG